MPPCYRPGTNLVRAAFLDPQVRGLYEDWGDRSAAVVAALRASAGPDAGDRQLTELVGELSLRSEEFQQLWARQDVRPRVSGSSVLDHPVVGRLDLGYEKLAVTSAPGQVLVVYHAVPGSQSAERLALLASLTATAGTEPGPGRGRAVRRRRPGARVAPPGRGGVARGPSPSPAVLMLEGRDAELGLIASLVGGVPDQGRALVLLGEPGAGKTALLRAAAQHAQQAGLLVLAASGVEFEAEIPYSGLGMLALPLIEAMGALPLANRQVLRTALGLDDGPFPTTGAVAGATLALFTGASAARPLLLTVDDLQWIDRMSAAALSFTARRLTSPRVGLLATLRTGTSTFFERSDLAEVEIGPLPRAAAERILSARFPALTRGEQARFVDEARGNALALLELPTALPGRQRLGGPSRASTSSSVSRRVQQLFAARVSGLPPRSREVLLLTALSGSGHLHVLRAAAGPPVLVDLAPAERADLVYVDDRARRVSFRHPLAAAAVVALSTAAERHGAHRALAAAVDGDVVRRAVHLAEATLEPDEEVATALDHAGKYHLRRGDANGAVEALIRAAQLSPASPDRNRRLAEAAYLGADVTGDLDGALELLDQARSGAVELQQSMAAVLATSYVLLHADSDIDAAHGLLAGALDARGDGLDAGDEDVVGVLRSLLVVCWTGGRAELWSAFHAAAAHLRPRAPELLLVCAGTFGDPVHAAAPLLPALARSIAALRDEHDPVQITQVGLASVYVDRVGDCRSALWRVVEDGRSGGAVALAMHALTTLCDDDWHRGRWDEVRELTAEGVRLAERLGYHQYSWILGGYLSTLVATARGDVDRSRAAADELSDWARSRGAGVAEMFAAHLRCLAALSAGDPEEAFQQACAISPAGVLPRHVPHALWVALDLVEAAERSGHHAEAQAHVDALCAHGVAELSTRLALVVRAASGVVAPERAYRELFEQALADPEAPQWRFDHARTRLLYGERLRRSRASKLARTHLAAAADLFADLGALPWQQRAERELRATGEHHTGRSRTTSHVLTAQELQIAMLAAEGKTNKEIGQLLYLSPRTVGAHLYSLFPRLGITSRAALRDALTGLGHVAVPPP
ncbi:AAA family ATPase [Blastococcus litoris]|uniref:MmyB family transcriptional regulator n=1 Tax=Blastococcus litoris TaxID=2171622 RepID=UPI000E30390E|nr:AAA family ATPase [Blastococcus litoris]